MARPFCHAAHAPTRVALALAIAGLCTTHASALALGSERVVSYLGQMLRVEIPVESSSQEPFDATCFTLVPPRVRDEVVPLRQGRIELSADRRRIIVRSLGNVDEPAVKFAIDVGCESKLRREFVVLLDPAPVVNAITPPIADSASVASQRMPSAAATSETPNAASAAATAANATRRSESGVGAARTAPRTNTEKTSRAAARASAPPRTRAATQSASSSRLVVKGAEGSGGNAAAVDAASLAALAVPQLRISGDLPTWALAETPVGPAGAAPLDELSAAIAKERRSRLANTPIEEDLPARLEADLVVAKKRIAELQSQLSSGTDVNARATGEKSPQASTATKDALPATKKGSADEAAFSWARVRDWLWAPAALVIAGLLAYLWFARRRQRNAMSTWATKPDVTVVQRGDVAAQGAPEFADEEPSGIFPSKAERRAQGAQLESPPTITPTLSPVAGVASAASTAASTAIASAAVASNASAREQAKAQIESPLFHPNQTSQHLDVTELSHVTDEAQVYADLGRVNEAIEILAHHIDSVTTDRPSPAPWLMMFELFRKANRRADYDRLAPSFRKLFNGRLPEWDDYSKELALDDGLEAFPHLIARIERDWGTAEVRPLLDELLYDNRGGSRLGFSLPAYRDLLLLLQVHDQLDAQGYLQAARVDRESAGANDEDGTPKWDLSLEMIEPPKPGELDEFLKSIPPKQ